MATRMTIPHLGDDGWDDLKALIRSENLTIARSRRGDRKWQFEFNESLTAGQRTMFEDLVTGIMSGVKWAQV